MAEEFPCLEEPNGEDLRRAKSAELPFSWWRPCQAALPFGSAAYTCAAAGDLCLAARGALTPEYDLPVLEGLDTGQLAAGHELQASPAAGGDMVEQPGKLPLFDVPHRIAPAN